MRKLDTTFEWDVLKTPLLVNVPDSENFSQVKGKKALIRSDNNNILSIVGANYTPIKNAFLEDTANKLAQSTGMELEGFDEFAGGKAVFAYLRNPSRTAITGYETNEYMVIGNYHSTDRSMFIGTVSKLLRCENEFGSIAVGHRIRHSSLYQTRTEELLGYFDIYKAERDRLAQKFLKWSKIPVDGGLVIAMMERVLRINDGIEEASPRTQGFVDTMSEAIERETSAMGSNLFALMNGVTYYTTHDRKVKNSVFGNLVGSNAIMNHRAFAFCEEVQSTYHPIING